MPFKNECFVIRNATAPLRRLRITQWPPVLLLTQSTGQQSSSTAGGCCQASSTELELHK